MDTTPNKFLYYFKKTPLILVPLPFSFGAPFKQMAEGAHDEKPALARMVWEKEIGLGLSGNRCTVLLGHRTRSWMKGLSNHNLSSQKCLDYQ